MGLVLNKMPGLESALKGPVSFVLRPYPLALPLFLSRASCGFPSPASDYVDDDLDLNRHLVEHPASTFFLRVTGDSMEPHIHTGDLLVIDRAVQPRSGQVVVAVIEGEFLVKRFVRQGQRVRLVADNLRYRPVEVTPEMGFEVWGVVTYVVHGVKEPAL